MSIKNTMKAHPILFSAAMIRALIDGNKTQTRRVVKPQPEPNDKWEGGWFINGKKSSFSIKHFNRFAELDICPYGNPGDLLWVRETFQGPLIDEDAGMPEGTYTQKYCVYRADVDNAPEFRDCDDNLKNCWKPSIFMPRWASRLTLRITGVRVERLQEISEGDAKTEGAPFELGALESTILGAKAKYRSGFCRLWQSINGADSWELNPWVWVIEFEVIQKNVNEVIGVNSAKEEK